MKRSTPLAITARILAILLVLTSLSPAFAQTSRGTVSGIVNDSAGAAIAGATIALTNNQTGVARTTQSNGEGLY